LQLVPVLNITGISLFFMGKKALKEYSETVKFLKKQYKDTPTVGIVLGSGLGNFIEEIQIEK